MKGGITFASAVLMFVTTVTAGGVPNDLCADAEAISGEGIFPFDNLKATMDDPSSDGCILWWSGGAITPNVWYCWTSPCDGNVTVDTCGGTTADTGLAVYEGCACPASEATLLICNNDACYNDLGAGSALPTEPTPPVKASGPSSEEIVLRKERFNFQSSATFAALRGESYLIRIGTNPLLGGVAGTFNVACGEAPRPTCVQTGDNCQDRDHWNAWVSDGRKYYVADDFTPRDDAAIDQICWWGAYFDGQGDCMYAASDAFEVTYFIDDGGVPGPWRVGPFSQADGSLVVEGPVRTYESLMDIDREYEYTAWHDPVEVFAGECYWIEITNTLTSECSWFWEGSTSGNGLAVQDGRVDASPDGYDLLDVRGDDLAFCLNIPLGATTPCHDVPINDTCQDRVPIFEGETFFDTSAATTEILTHYPCNPDPTPCCGFPLGDAQVYKDIWYDYEPACSGRIDIDLCGNHFDTKVAIYEDFACSNDDAWAIACSDDACGDDLRLQSELSAAVSGGTQYMIRVGSYGYTVASDCLTDQGTPGCDDRDCEWLVCAEDPTCCDVEWHFSCASAASRLCRGRGGPGTISFDIVVPSELPPALWSYAEFTVCFTGECSDGPCDPPMYPVPCCEPYDIDFDGDVDLDDYHSYHQDWTGP